MTHKLSYSERTLTSSDRPSFNMPCLPRPEMISQDGLQAQKKALEDAQRKAASSKMDADAAQERTRQVQEEMSNKLQMAAAEREAFFQRLQGFEQSAQPSAEDVSEPSLVHLPASLRRHVWGATPQLLSDRVTGLLSAKHHAGSSGTTYSDAALQVGPEERTAAADEAMDWKARATKLKRQALTYKTKYSEAAAARDAAMAELQALKGVRACIMR